MNRVLLLTLSCCLLAPTVFAQAYTDNEAKIRSAMSAAPNSIADIATIIDWPAEAGGEMSVLREGSRDWTCLPDMPATSGDYPMCLDQPWLLWADAWMNHKEFQATQTGFGYMLQGGTAESNIDPYADGPTEDNEWMTEGVPHLMIIVPDPEMLAGLPTTADSGGPWVMWRDTPFVHVMVPMPLYEADE